MYGYVLIIFGLAVSPYFLGAVIQHNAGQYPSDLCSFLLMKNLYMDNFLYTSSCLDSLQEIYHLATSLMKEGGLDLCSWNSNSVELRKLFEREGKPSKHQSSEEKVLGYLFDISSDFLRLSDFILGNVTTKRHLLSEIAKVFDPLSLFLLVTIRGHLLMKMWEKEMRWDDEIDQELKVSWEKLRLDFDSLKEVTFARSCFETEDPDLTLNIFCDASMA